MNYSKIKPFIVKFKNGKINFEASVKKYKKELNKILYPIKDELILKVIKKTLFKNKSLHGLCDVVLMNVKVTPTNIKYVKAYVHNFIKKNTGKQDDYLLGFSKRKGYWLW